MGWPLQESDCDLLLRSAREAGEIARRYFGRDPKVWEKSDGAGPVTEADLEIDAYLKQALLAARPGYGWLSEESEDTKERLSCERVFILDPIDGTRGFIRGDKNFGVSIAIARGGEITDAVFEMPAKSVTYAASKGKGASKNGVPISARAPAGLEGARVLATKEALNPDLWQTPPSIRPYFRPSLAYRLCLVAEGAFDAMISFRNIWEWDSAAGALIAAEANAKVMNKAGEAIQFNQERAYHEGCFAGAPSLMNEVLTHLRS